jgi:glycosyltransferase involved in cell wall biosynthesis
VPDDAVEILVPFWGDPELLYATVESVRSQSDQAWRLTVVDDCYPDPSVAEHFATETDPRIGYVRNETNLGITDNYARCRDLATGELMMFLGCDDLLDATFVGTVRAAHEQFPAAAIIQVGVRVIDEAGRPADPLGDKVKRATRPRVHGRTELGGERLATSLLRGNWLYWPALVFRTERVQSYEFRAGLPIIQDLALVIDMVAAGETLVVDPEIYFSYRRHTQSASSSSLLHGRRLPDERRYYALAAEQMRARGWRRAARTARVRGTSRLHALTLLPEAIRRRSWSSVPTLARHAFGR